MTKNSSNMGRQKITMTKIAKKNHLQVTFSKRRAGLFKKASELCTLCGVEVSIIVFSPADKVFSFGHPRVESIVDRFLSIQNSPNLQNSSTTTTTTTTHRLIENQPYQNAYINELNIQLTWLLDHLDIERKKGEELDNIRKLAIQSQYWWQTPINELGLNELKELKVALEELQKKVANQTNKDLVESINYSHWEFSALNNGVEGQVNPNYDNKLIINECNLNCNFIDHYDQRQAYYSQGIGYGCF